VEAEPAGGSVGSNVPVVRNGTRIVAVANQKGGVGSAGGARDPCFARYNVTWNASGCDSGFECRRLGPIPSPE
jgi:hypothetical protein